MKGLAYGLFGFVALVAIILGGWQAGWWFTAQNVDRNYHVNTHSQQYQGGLIQQARDDARGWAASMDPSQKDLLKGEFCGAYADLTEVPNDVASDAAQMGC